MRPGSPRGGVDRGLPGLGDGQWVDSLGRTPAEHLGPCRLQLGTVGGERHLASLQEGPGLCQGQWQTAELLR